MNTQNKKVVEMDLNLQIQKFIPALGYSYEIEHKAVKMTQNGNFEHKIDIDENAKKIRYTSKLSEYY